MIKYENECKNHLKELNSIHENSFRKKFQIEFSSLFTSNVDNIENFIISNIGAVGLKETEIIETKSEENLIIINKENLIEEDETIVDLIGLNIEQQTQNNITVIPSSSSSSSSSPTIVSPLNARRKYKTNLSIIKEAGIWGGDENVEFWYVNYIL